MKRSPSPEPQALVIRWLHLGRLLHATTALEVPGNPRIILTSSCADGRHRDSTLLGNGESFPATLMPPLRWSRILLPGSLSRFPHADLTVLTSDSGRTLRLHLPSTV